MVLKSGAIASLLTGTCVLITILLTSATRAQLAGSPWPTFKHDSAHTGLSQFDTSANPGLQKWAFGFPPSNPGFSQYASPALGADGTIYSTPGDDNLYALGQDGTLTWTYMAAGPMIATPAIGADGTIYVTSEGNVRTGYLYAVNPAGTLKWSYSTGFGCESSPVIGSDGTIYFYCDDGILRAINPDGSEKWELAEGPNGTNEPSSPAIGTDGTIYFGSADYNLYAVSPDGSLKWSYPTPGDVESSPAIGPDGTIYVGSEATGASPHSIGYLFAINPDGSLKWYYTTPNYWVLSSPAIGSDGSIYFGDGASIVALDADGTLKWEIYSHEDSPVSSPVIGADGTIYAGADDGNVYAVNPNGSIKWKFYTSPVTIMGSSPAIGADGTVYIEVYPYGPVTSLYAIGQGGPTPTPTPTPVAGELRVSPQTLHFGEVYLGDTKTKSVKIANLGMVTKKSTPPPILIEGESNVSGPFSLSQTCTGKELAPRSKSAMAGNCEISVTFAPTEAIEYSDSFSIKDNLEPNFGQTIKLMGVGKAPKKRLSLNFRFPSPSL
jgi:outer membrane protein assembly factor BamB